MSDGSKKGFGFKRLAAILLLTVLVLVVFAFSINGLLVPSADLANQPAASATPTQPSPTTSLTPTQQPPTAPPTDAATPTLNPTQIPIPVDFTCNYEGNKDTFTVTTTIDLNDGMNREEAVIVATAIIIHELNNAKHEVRIAEVITSGQWHVGINWEYGMIDINGTDIEPTLGHVFDVTINEKTRTATYTRCM